MIFFTYIGLILLPLIYAIFVMLFFVFILDSALRRHDLPTSKRAIKFLVEAISKNSPDAKNFYDLGCGRGTVVLAVKKILPRLAVYGVDDNRIRIFFAYLKSIILRQKINFKKQDVFHADIKNADIVYTYLWYDLMPILEKKLQKELKPGAIVITNTSHFSNWKPIKKIVTYPKKLRTPNFETLFVYKK